MHPHADVCNTVESKYNVQRAVEGKDVFILCLRTPVLVSPCASLCKRPLVSDGEGENVSRPRASEQGLAHLSVFARRFVGGSRLQVCWLTGMGDFYEDNKSKLPHQPYTP